MMCEITQPSPNSKYVHFLPPFPLTFRAVALASAEKTVISLTNVSAIFKGCSVGAERKAHSLCQKNEQPSRAPLPCACRSQAAWGPVRPNQACGRIPVLGQLSVEAAGRLTTYPRLT